MTTADPREELSAVTGVRIDAVWRDPNPQPARMRQGWQVAAAGRVWHFASTDDLRDPHRLNAWRNTVANCRRTSRDEPWQTLPALSRAEARRVVRLLHDVAERRNVGARASRQPNEVVGQ